MSRVYETEPVGYTEQPNFLNQAVEIEPSFAPAELLLFLKSTEKKMGRQKNFRWGPRLIDIDIVFYGSRIVRENGLVVPHERLHERRFVLEPLCELAPEFVHPTLGKTAGKLLELLGSGGGKARIFSE